jgi:hypothetical protein
MKKAVFEYLDPPGSVDTKVLALSMAIAATVGDVTKKIGLDPATVTIKLDVGSDSIRFRLQSEGSL